MPGSLGGGDHSSCQVTWSSECEFNVASPGKFVNSASRFYSRLLIWLVRWHGDMAQTALRTASKRSSQCSTLIPMLIVVHSSYPQRKCTHSSPFAFQRNLRWHCASIAPASSIDCYIPFPRRVLNPQQLDLAFHDPLMSSVYPPLFPGLIIRHHPTHFHLPYSQWYQQ